MSAGFTLEAKGQGHYIPINQLSVSLKWTAAVDLDLMAFYKTKDGSTGGVYSDNYMGGNLGTLNAFPFMQLSGDAGGGATAGDNVETMRILKLDNIAELHIIAVNHTDAVAGTQATFAHYDGHVEVATDAGETITIPLASNDQGCVACICKIVNTNPITGPQLLNESIVESFESFQARVPGAAGLQLSSKIVLTSKGDAAPLSASDDVECFLQWTSAVDLDLHCFYRLKGAGSTSGASSSGGLAGLFGSMTGAGGGPPPPDEHIYFQNMGDLDTHPHICLHEDEGVGAEGGDNEELISIRAIEPFEHILIVANIYGEPNSNFASYDGSVQCFVGGQEINVPLTESTQGSWCVVARIDNSTGSPKLINVNRVVANEPKINDYL